MFRSKISSNVVDNKNKSDAGRGLAIATPQSSSSIVKPAEIIHEKVIHNPISMAQSQGIFNKNNGFGGKSKDKAKMSIDEESNVADNDPGVSMQDISAYIVLLSKASQRPISKDKNLREVSNALFDLQSPSEDSGNGGISNSDKMPTGSTFRSRIVQKSSSSNIPSAMKTVEFVPKTKSPLSLSSDLMKLSLKTKSIGSIPHMESEVVDKKDQVMTTRKRTHSDDHDYQNKNKDKGSSSDDDDDESSKRVKKMSIKCHQLLTAQRRRLCNKVRKFLIPDSHKTKVVPERKVPKKKQIRTAPPTAEDDADMAAVEQNSEKWFWWRSFQFGASGLSTILGWSHYRLNTTQWEIDVGRQSEVPGDLESFRFADEGHWGEDEAADVYHVLMGAKTVKTFGMTINGKYPLWHCSPDRLVEMPDDVYHNRHTYFDSKEYALEIKYPYFSNYKRRQGIKGVPPHVTPPGYVMQIQAQTAIMNKFLNSKHADLCAHWHFKEDAPPNFMGDGKFHIADTNVTRVYYNPEMVKQMYEMTETYANCVRNEIYPVELHEPDFPAIDILPLKSAKFILTCPKDEQGNWMYGPIDEFTGHPSAPFDEEGYLIGNVDVEITDYFDTPIQRLTLKEMSML